MIKKMIILAVILSIAGATALSGCVRSEDDTSGIDKIFSNATKNSQQEASQSLKKFSSTREILEFLKAAQSNAGRYDVIYPLYPFRDSMVGGSPMAVPAVANAPAPKAVQEGMGGSGTLDYSKTNVQVEGVDEADFVKNDGKYIYVLAQNKLVIIDAFPASGAKTLSESAIKGRPSDMFVNGDRLIVFTEDDNQVYIYPEYEYRPVPRYTPETVALVYDITDREKPEQIANFSINGNYFRSRMIGDYIYFIVKDNVYYYSDVVDVPVIRQGQTKILAPDVYYFDNPEQNYVFHTIASISMKSLKMDAKVFMMGYSDNLYVSENNIYITYRKNLPFRYYEEQREERFFKVVVPLLPKDAQDKIKAIKDSNLDSYEKWDKISSILEDTYNRMSENEKLEYNKNVEKAIEEYEIKLAQEREKTVVQKIGINNGDIQYRTRGEVPGSLLNQFSMDESNDFFRVATTSQFWTRNKGSVQYNNVYVMDKDLGIAGKLEEIAPDERIYSTRFIGNRLYMVTFKRIDPLFVIDLSDARNPKILGELKIPGFSDYLHPYDENHVIGVGKETGENEWGGVSIKGVKLSLFDVSDVKNPKQLDTYEIGKAGTDSEALRDHKAFLFDKKKNLLVIPIREVLEKEQYNSRYGYYMQRVWQGAYVFGLTLKGFELKGRISHLDDYEEMQYYWNSPGAVRRSLYMDDVLYTVSARKIMMNGLDNLSEIKSIDLPFDKNRYNEYGWR